MIKYQEGIYIIAGYSNDSAHKKQYLYGSSFSEDHLAEDDDAIKYGKCYVTYGYDKSRAATYGLVTAVPKLKDIVANSARRDLYVPLNIHLERVISLPDKTTEYDIEEAINEKYCLCIAGTLGDTKVYLYDHTLGPGLFHDTLAATFTKNKDKAMKINYKYASAANCVVDELMTFKNNFDIVVPLDLHVEEFFER